MKSSENISINILSHEEKARDTPWRKRVNYNVDVKKETPNGAKPWLKMS